MPLLVPERTIDTLLTFELISAAPTVVIHSPHNNSGPRTPDHIVRSAHRTAIFECKTLYTKKNRARAWVVKVPRKQLSAYVLAGQTSLVYVLPSRPRDVDEPWIRDGCTDPDAQGRCTACLNPPATSGALHVRRWAGRSTLISTAPPETRLQPWFNHWAWCVRADDLHRHLVTGPAKPGGTAEISADDAHLGGLPGAVRLCHLLADVGFDHDRLVGGTRRLDPDDDLVAVRERLDRFSVETLTMPRLRRRDHPVVAAY